MESKVCSLNEPEGVKGCLGPFGAAITKFHRLSALQRTDIYCSQFWRKCKMEATAFGVC